MHQNGTLQKTKENHLFFSIGNTSDQSGRFSIVMLGKMDVFNRRYLFEKENHLPSTSMTCFFSKTDSFRGICLFRFASKVASGHCEIVRIWDS